MQIGMVRSYKQLRANAPIHGQHKVLSDLRLSPWSTHIDIGSGAQSGLSWSKGLLFRTNIR